MKQHLTALRFPRRFVFHAFGGILAVVSGLYATTYVAEATPNVRTVEVVLDDTGMSPMHIQAKEDRPLHLHIVNRGHKEHQFSIPGFYIFTRTLYPGETSDVEFAPYKAGWFAMSSDPVSDGQPEYIGKIYIHP